MLIECIADRPAAADCAQLQELLIDAVASGASVGFLAPLAHAAAQAYWNAVFAELPAGIRVLLVARDQERIVGSIQLECTSLQNAAHRAEVQKLLVHSAHRRRRLGHALMLAIEQQARTRGRSLLYWNTRVGDAADRLYTSMGYPRVGVIPAFALSSAGTLDATVYYYKRITDAGL